MAATADTSRMAFELGLGLASACALATNLGFLCKHRGARRAPTVELRRPLRSAQALLRSRWFAVGMAIALAAGVFHVAALALAPLSLVQAVIAGGFVLLALMARGLFGYRVAARQWGGVALAAAGFILLALTLPSAHGAHAAYSGQTLLAGETALAAGGILLVTGPRFRLLRRHAGVLIATGAGLFFAATDVAIKALVGLISDAAPLAVMSPWLAIALAVGLAAQYASARGLQLGDAVSVIATTGAAATVATIAGGLVIFADPLRHDSFGRATELVAFILIAVAALVTPAPITNSDA